MKRDDLLSFGQGGNKVRKMQTVIAEARQAGADMLITCGGVQSNHARVTAAAGAALGMKVAIVANGVRPATLTGNARLDALFGAEVHYVDSRDERVPTMEAIAIDARVADFVRSSCSLGARRPQAPSGLRAASKSSPPRPIVPPRSCMPRRLAARRRASSWAVPCLA